MICSHCKTIGDVYYCTACGDPFFAEQPVCPDDPHGHAGAIQTYAEHVSEQLSAAFTEQLPQLLDAQLSPLIARLDRLLDRQIPLEELRALAEEKRLAMAAQQ